MYMGPGTPHLVFRLPQGKQTAAIAEHVVRRHDVALWLQMLCVEVEMAVGEDETEEGFADVVVSLSDSIDHHLEQAEAVGSQERYGGAKVIKRAGKLIKKLGELRKQL